MRSSFTLRLAHEELAQLGIRRGLRVKDVIFKPLAVAKPRGPERVRHGLGRVQVGNRDLEIDDILRAES
jgi:hypothetical protein